MRSYDYKFTESRGSLLRQAQIKFKNDFGSRYERSTGGWKSNRHEVLPGITGLAQVQGRNALAWETRLELDVRYVEQQSFQLDLKILWMTMACVLTRSGISHEGHATMPNFSGPMK